VAFITVGDDAGPRPARLAQGLEDQALVFPSASDAGQHGSWRAPSTSRLLSTGRAWPFRFTSGRARSESGRARRRAVLETGFTTASKKRGGDDSSRARATRLPEHRGHFAPEMST